MLQNVVFMFYVPALQLTTLHGHGNTTQLSPSSAVAVAPKPLLPSYIAAAVVTPFLPFYFMILKTPGFTIYGV